MIKSLVTGGKGFIGSHLVNYLKEKGHWVRSLDQGSESYLRTNEDKFSQGDLRKVSVAKNVTKDIEFVWNCAANMGGIGFITKVGAEVMHDNVLINANILQACVENRVKRILFSSSACIYPTYRQMGSEVEPLKEEYAYPADPDNFYGWEKLFTERMMMAYQRDYGLDIRIARLHNIYGPYGTYKGGREKAPAALCRKVAEAPDGGKITIWGDGKQTRSFLYVDDCIRAIDLLMNSDYDKPLNIGSDRLVTIDWLAETIIRISGKKLKMVHDLTKPQGVRGRNADLTLIEKVLGWEPEVSLEEGLEKTYRWVEEMVKKRG